MTDDGPAKVSSALEHLEIKKKIKNPRKIRQTVKQSLVYLRSNRARVGKDIEKNGAFPCK
jgi:hypothetical protein